ncbi:hypothetical protein [Halobacteriovorax sp.]|uniref:hypothetical protein n=1 Tax=Halobacteriovorax sp. TaxID=2020862 RepID=UPI0035687800
MLIKLVTLFICFSVSFSASARGKFIVYTEAFDVFEIVDGISQWKIGTPIEYREYYENTFGLSNADKEMLKKYKAIREKYHREYPKAENSIFSESELSSDIIARTFASSMTIDQALKTLKKKKRMEVEDIKELVLVYKHFKKNISTIVKESSLLESEAKRLSKLIKKSRLTRNIKKLDKFFNLPTSKIKGGRVKLVWWPRTDKPSIAVQGGRVIFRVNPIKQAGMIDEELLMQSLVRSLIISQGKTVKENLSKVFIEGCPSIKDKKMAVDLWFEEPLVEAISKYYLPYESLKKKFNPYSVKSETPWINTFSKFLFGLTQYSVKRRSQFDMEFVSTGAKFCQNLLNL